MAGVAERRPSWFIGGDSAVGCGVPDLFAVGFGGDACPSGEGLAERRGGVVSDLGGDLLDRGLALGQQ